MKRDMVINILLELLQYIQSDANKEDYDIFISFLQVFILSEESLLLLEMEARSRERTTDSQQKKLERYLATPVHEHLEIKIQLADAFKPQTVTKDIYHETLNCINIMILTNVDKSEEGHERHLLLLFLSILSLHQSVLHRCCIVEKCHTPLECHREIERYNKFASDYSDLTHDDTLEMYMSIQDMNSSKYDSKPCIECSPDLEAELTSLKQNFSENIEQLQKCVKSYMVSRQEAYRTCFMSPTHCLNCPRASSCHLWYQISPTFVNKLLHSQMSESSKEMWMPLITTVSNHQNDASRHQDEMDIYVIKHKVGNYHGTSILSSLLISMLSVTNKIRNKMRPTSGKFKI